MPEVARQSAPVNKRWRQLPDGEWLEIADKPRGSKTVTAVSCTSGSATQVLAANDNRKSASLKNTGAATVYLGLSDVTINTGYPLAAGESLTDGVSLDAWYGITASGTADVRVIEVS